MKASGSTILHKLEGSCSSLSDAIESMMGHHKLGAKRS